jgi:hypothetical protein
LSFSCGANLTAAVGQCRHFSYPVNTATKNDHFLQQQSHLEGRTPNTRSNLTTQTITTKHHQTKNQPGKYRKNYEPANAQAVAIAG